jgi:hypothetical protein
MLWGTCVVTSNGCTTSREAPIHQLAPTHRQLQCCRCWPLLASCHISRKCKPLDPGFGLGINPRPQTGVYPQSLRMPWQLLRLRRPWVVLQRSNIRSRECASRVLLLEEGPVGAGSNTTHIYRQVHVHCMCQHTGMVSVPGQGYPPFCLCDRINVQPAMQAPNILQPICPCLRTPPVSRHSSASDVLHQTH